MKNLLNFIYRNNFFFMFLVLEFICVFILIRNNGYQGSSLLNSSNAISANIYAMQASSKLGVTRDMAVISSNGIIGIVKDVSPNFSSVMSILHKDVRVYCQLKKDGVYGPLIWDGSDYRYSNLINIPTYSKIRKGDTIITSSLSGIFPEGLLVGFVESYERRQNESFYTVKVRLSADFKKVNHISVVRYNKKAERDSLELKSQVQSDK